MLTCLGTTGLECAEFLSSYTVHYEKTLLGILYFHSHVCKQSWMHWGRYLHMSEALSTSLTQFSFQHYGQNAQCRIASKEHMFICKVELIHMFFFQYSRSSVSVGGPFLDLLWIPRSTYNQICSRTFGCDQKLLPVVSRRLSEVQGVFQSLLTRHF